MPEGMSVLVEDGTIREVTDKPIKSSAAAEHRCRGRTLMPGLIDMHLHAYACDVNVQKVDSAGEPYRTAHAMRMLGHALDCGLRPYAISAAAITASGARSKTG